MRRQLARNILFCSLSLLSCRTIAPSLQQIAEETGVTPVQLEKEILYLKDFEKRLQKKVARGYPTVVGFLKRKKVKRGCEVGVAWGRQSNAILRETKVKCLYSVDPYSCYPEFNLQQQHFDILYIIVRNLLAQFGSRSKLLRMRSLDAIPHVEDNLDFVYIDGDHSYEAVIADLEHWFTKIRNGGFLICDDYGGGHKGVTKAVDEFVRVHKLQLQGLGHRKIVIRKP